MLAPRHKCQGPTSVGPLRLPRQYFLAPQAWGPRHARFSRGGVEAVAQRIARAAKEDQRSGARFKKLAIRFHSLFLAIAIFAIRE
jgi:hypothetical protein